MKNGTLRVSRRTLWQSALSLTLLEALPETVGHTEFAQPVQAQAHEKNADGMLGSIVRQWNSVALQCVSTTNVPAPICARALAILHTSIFDAWAAYDAVAVGTRFGDTLRQPQAARSVSNKAMALSYAAYRVLLDLFPSESAIFNTLMQSLGYDPNNGAMDISSPNGIGNLVALGLLAFRHKDGSNQLGDLHPGAYSDYTGYTPVNSPDIVNDLDRWQPLRVPNGHGGFVIQKCVTPQWGRVIPFALTIGSQFRPAGPIRSSQGAFLDEVNEILLYSAQLNDKTKAIAEYWSDGPGTIQPPGHWSYIAQISAASAKYHDAQTAIDNDVKLFFILANAMLDVSIAVWDCKLAFDSVRPITAVQYLYAGQSVRAWAGPGMGTQAIDGGQWMPYQLPTFVTPPFPEYVSGHSTFSAAGAYVLSQFQGSDTFDFSYAQRSGTSRIEPGITPTTDISLSWPTFLAAANEAGLSRRYGGIHFSHSDLDGRTLGRNVASLVWGKALSYINGTSSVYLTEH